MGDDAAQVPLSILEHFTNPIDMNGPDVEDLLAEIERDLPMLNDGML
mgnify:CR=1 FL=1